MRKVLIAIFPVVIVTAGLYFFIDLLGRTLNEKGEDTDVTEASLENAGTAESVYLTDQEIKSRVMKFEELKEILLKFSSEMPEETDPKVRAAKIMEMLPANIHELASEAYIEQTLPNLMGNYFLRMGEGGLFPQFHFDVRMQVVKNTSEQLLVKSFQLENESYLESLNVYVSFVNKDGNWLFDGLETVPAQDEPINLTKQEMISYLKKEYGNEDLVFIAEEQVATRRVFVYQSKAGSTYFAHYADTGEIAWDIIEKYNGM